MSGARPRSGLLSRLAGLLGRTDDGETGPAPAEAPVQPGQLTDDAFELSIKQMLAEDDGNYRTKLQIISLVEFREAVGDKWQQVADKVMMIAEGVIQLHLGPGNSFGRQGQDYFVLLFRTCAHTEARRRALDIAQELGTRLVGDKVLGADRPLALAAEVHLAGAANLDGTLNTKVVAQAINEVRAIVALANHDAVDAGTRSWMKQRLAAPTAPPPLRAHLRPSTPLPPRPRAAGTPGKAARKLPAAPSGLIDFDQRLRDLDLKWKTLNPNALDDGDELVDGPRPLPPETRLSLLWRPTWSDDEAIGSYRALIQRVNHPDEPALEGSRAYAGNEATAQTLDHFVIAHAMRAFLAAEKGGLGATIVLPIHWATLYSTQRMRLLAPMADATMEARSARMVIELFGIPGDIEADDLEAATGVLRCTCREVLWRTPLAAPHAGLAARCGASCIAADLADLDEVERCGDEELLRRLETYLNAAEAEGLGACLWGVRRRNVVASAALAGFAMINGPALMKDLAKPAIVVPAPLSKFGATTF